MNGEERNLSSLSLSLSISLFSWYFFSLKRRIKRMSLKFSLMHTLLIALLVIYLRSTGTSSYEISELESQTSREDDGNRKKKERKERPTRWTMNSDARLTEQENNEWLKAFKMHFLSLHVLKKKNTIHPRSTVVY
jgi:hypothetical protein